MTKRILAPIQKNDGCSFYRLETPAHYFKSTDISVDLHPLKINKYKSHGRAWDYLKWFDRYQYSIRASHYDAAWINRSLLSFKNKLDLTIQNVVYDFDDAIWLNGEADHCFKQYCERALVVFAGNEFLAEHAAKFSGKVKIIPTSVETKRYQNLKYKKEQFCVGWIGSSSGLIYLKDIEEQLATFFKAHTNAKLVIVSERYPAALTSLSQYIEYIPWSRNGDVEALNKFSVGIMPLRDTEWDRGKCSFKMLQYMACEIPVIVSPVGMNNEVMQHVSVYGPFGLTAGGGATAWVDALEHFYEIGESRREEAGLAGAAVIRDIYETAKITQDIELHLKNYL